MDDFYDKDPILLGSKGLVYIGEKVLVYRRDGNTDLFPFHIDLPGGRAELNETPFDTFRREVKEEFGLEVGQNDIAYVRCYQSTFEEDKKSYFPVAKLPKSAESQIIFGDEGTEYMIMSIEEYLARDDAWKLFQERTIDYINSLSK